MYIVNCIVIRKHCKVIQIFYQIFIYILSLATIFFSAVIYFVTRLIGEFCNEFAAKKNIVMIL